jgi:hypothetical protein
MGTTDAVVFVAAVLLIVIIILNVIALLLYSDKTEKPDVKFQFLGLK